MLMTAGTLVFAAVMLALAFIRVSELAALALVIGGVAWILVLSTLNSQYQTTLPGWAKARGMSCMSYYLVVFQGGGALGSAVFGIVAQDAGLRGALLVAAAGLALVALAGAWLPFRAISAHDLLPAGDWPARDSSARRSPTGRGWSPSNTGPSPGSSGTSWMRSTPGAAPGAAPVR